MNIKVLSQLDVHKWLYSVYVVLALAEEQIHCTAACLTDPIIHKMFCWFSTCVSSHVDVDASIMLLQTSQNSTVKSYV
jgi:hypothetical protein